MHMLRKCPISVPLQYGRRQSFLKGKKTYLRSENIELMNEETIFRISMQCLQILTRSSVILQMVYEALILMYVLLKLCMDRLFEKAIILNDGYVCYDLYGNSEVSNITMVIIT